MDSIAFILAIALPVYSLVTVLLGVWLGHKITMKAFSHVQPSTKEMTKMATHGSVTQEEDWFDESQKDQAPPMDNAEEEVLREAFEKTGLPEEIWNSYKKTGRHPQEFFGYDVPYSEGGVEEEIDKAYDISDLKKD